MLSENEARQKAMELIDITYQQKELAEKIKNIKAELIDYASMSNLNDISWGRGNDLVEVSTKVTYSINKDVPVKHELDVRYISKELAEECTTPKTVLSKRGRKRIEEGDAEDLMPILDKKIKLCVKVYTS